MGYDTYWVDDKLSNQGVIQSGDYVIACNVAAQHLPNISGARYILHNIDPHDVGITSNYIKLQVFTEAAVGESIDSPVIKWDSTTRTLFQPWGISVNRRLWLKDDLNPGKREYWIGAIWNNPERQGNTDEINAYRESLSKLGLLFRRVGGTRSIKLAGISDEKSSYYTSISPIAASIVGKWQKDKSYIPCRAFRNVAFGAVPASNSALSQIFGDSMVFNEQISELVNRMNSMSLKEKRDRNSSALHVLNQHTYEINIQRLMQFF